MTARVPGEEVEVRQAELVDEVRHPARVLMAAMEQHDGPARRAAGRRPVAIEEVDAVVRAKRALVHGARAERVSAVSFIQRHFPSRKAASHAIDDRDDERARRRAA